MLHVHLSVLRCVDEKKKKFYLKEQFIDFEKSLI